MKMQGFIGAFLLLLLTACGGHEPVAMRQDTPLPSELVAVDTLMQIQPDSALALLLDQPKDDPYYQLLLSEALYKNDFAQANRDALQAAMAYYDSIGNPFLAARCHYMNGVGYYEMDSVVPACEQYLKALEIMGTGFEEKDLVGYKAKFMALTYTHLGGLFSDQYLHEQAIYFAKQSLSYYDKYEAMPWHVAWALNMTGMHYHIIQQWDSADCYYNKAAEVLLDTNTLIYRDIKSGQTYLFYQTGMTPEKTLEQFRRLLSQAENEQERFPRCLAIGDIFYQEKAYDSAWLYLDSVYKGSSNIALKKQAAQWLAEICKLRGLDSEVYQYTNFLVPFAVQEENNGDIKSRLTELYSTFCKKAQEQQYQWAKKENKKNTVLVLFGILLTILVVYLFYLGKRKKWKSLKCQINEKQSPSKKWNRYEQFLGETVCQEIIRPIQEKNIKRSTLPSEYPELHLNDAQLQQLAVTVHRYFGSLDKQLELHGIASNDILVNVCHLYLLGMNEKRISILLNRDYSTVTRYEKKLQNQLGTQKKMVQFIRDLVLNTDCQ